MKIADLLIILELVAKYGLPAVSDMVDHFIASNGFEPTAQQAKELMDGVEPPIPPADL